MSDSALLFESLRLMLIGMGIVFSFLLTLVGILRVMSWAALRLAPVSVEPEPMTQAPSPEGPPVAVIAAAIARYRAARRSAPR